MKDKLYFKKLGGGQKVAIDITDLNFKKEVLESNLPVLVDFWAPWCGPCSMIASIIEEISKEYEGKLKVCKLDVDEARSTATQYQIMSIPALLVFKNGEIVDKTMGVISKDKLEDVIKPHV